MHEKYELVEYNFVNSTPLDMKKPNYQQCTPNPGVNFANT